MTLLTETNKELVKLSLDLNNKITLFCKKYPKSLFRQEIITFYNTILLPWAEEYQQFDREPFFEYDLFLKNEIKEISEYIDYLSSSGISLDASNAPINKWNV